MMKRSKHTKECVMKQNKKPKNVMFNTSNFSISTAKTWIKDKSSTIKLWVKNKEQKLGEWLTGNKMVQSYISKC